MQTSFFSDNPELVAMAIATFGFFAAKLLGRLTDGWFLLLQRTVQRAAPFKTEKHTFSRLQPVFKGVVYYSTLFFFLLLAIHVLGVVTLEDWLAALLAYIPQLILAGIIIISGYLAGVLARGLVASVIDEKPQHVLPRIAQAIVVTAAVMTGLGQMAIDISFVSDVIVILLGAFAGGLSLAFALGSRQFVANLLARRDLDRYSVGSRIQIDGTEGRIIELLNTAVVLESKAGTVTIPTARFAESGVVLLDDEVLFEGEDNSE